MAKYIPTHMTPSLLGALIRSSAMSPTLVYLVFCWRGLHRRKGIKATMAEVSRWVEELSGRRINRGRLALHVLECCDMGIMTRTPINRYWHCYHLGDTDVCGFGSDVTDRAGNVLRLTQNRTPSAGKRHAIRDGLGQFSTNPGRRDEEMKDRTNGPSVSVDLSTAQGAKTPAPLGGSPPTPQGGGSGDRAAKARAALEVVKAQGRAYADQTEEQAAKHRAEVKEQAAAVLAGEQPVDEPVPIYSGPIPKGEE